MQPRARKKPAKREKTPPANFDVQCAGGQIARRVGRSARPSASSAPGWACRPGSASMDAPCGPRKSASAASLPSGALARAIKGPALRPLMLPLTVMRMERFHLRGAAPDTGELFYVGKGSSPPARRCAAFLGALPIFAHTPAAASLPMASPYNARLCRNMWAKPLPLRRPPALRLGFPFHASGSAFARKNGKYPFSLTSGANLPFLHLRGASPSSCALCRYLPMRRPAALLQWHSAQGIPFCRNMRTKPASLASSPCLAP